MPKLNLIQGSPEWHLFRERHIMATAASCIIGLNPYKSCFNLWEEMMCMAPPVIMNTAMKRGVELEPFAREIACKILEMEFDPCVYLSDQFYWQAASLDGLYIPNNVVLEIKCPNKIVHEAASVCSIPEYYICQLQHQISVTNASKAIYFSYRPNNKGKENGEPEFFILDVFRNEEFIKELEKIEWNFWTDFCRLQSPSIVIDNEILEYRRALLKKTQIQLLQLPKES